MSLNISLLGPLQLTYQHNVISNLDTVKAKALLAYLAMAPQRKHKRTTLAALLWPEHDETVARNNLRQTLYRLNKHFPPDVDNPLMTTRNTLRLNEEACWVDVHSFQRLWHTCQKHAHVEMAHCLSCIHRLEELVALYRAPFLADLIVPDCAEYELWLVQQQEWFQAKTQRAYQTLVSHYAREQIDTALAYCRRWVSFDPYNEEAQRQLMQLLAQKGQRGLALAQYESLRELLGEELRIAPTAETTAVYEMIRHGQPQPPPPALSNQPLYRLQTLPTNLIGREDELACLDDWLGSPACRLVTIVGLPGSGSSTLAIESARAHAGQFAHGVLHVSLRHAATTDAFWQALGTALELPSYTSEQIEHNATAVLAQQQTLLLLDDWHTPTSEAAASLLRLLHHAPLLKIVVTSHERLNLSVEWLLILSGLECSVTETDSAETIASQAAVRLFLAHVQRVRGGFTPTAADWQAMAAISRQLGGHPQALIALATSARLMSLPALQQALQQDIWQGLGLQTVVTEMSHRWEALSAEVRQQCAALTMFAPASTTAAIQAVCNLHLSDVGRLVESALLTQSEGVVQMPPLWHAYVRTRQTPSPTMRQAHASYYEALLAEQVKPLRQYAQRTAVQALSEARDNIVQAWRVLSATPGEVRPHAAWGLFHWYDIMGEVDEAQTLLALPTRTPLLQAMQGWFAFRSGQVGLGHHLLLGQAEQLAQQTDQQPGMLVRCYTAVVLNNLGNLEGAEREIRQAWLVSQQLGDLWSNALALNIAGDIAFARANLNRAAELYQQSLALKRIVQDDWGQAFCLVNLGHVAYAEKRYEEATYYYQQGLELREFVGDVRRTAGCYAQLGHVAHQTADYVAAQTHYRASHHIYKQYQDVPRQIKTLLWTAHAQQEAQSYSAAMQTYQEGLALAVRQEQGQQVIEILLAIHHLQVELTHLGQKLSVVQAGDTAVDSREEIMLQNLLAHFNLLRQRPQGTEQLRANLQQFVRQLFPTVPSNLSLRL